MSKVLSRPQGASQRVVSEPERGKSCAQCGKPFSEVRAATLESKRELRRGVAAGARAVPGIEGAGDGDPFCSADCCRRFYDVDWIAPAASRVPVDTVRPDALKCYGCDEWHPDEAFAVASRRVGRRGRRSVCKECQRKLRKGRGRGKRGVCASCGGRCSSDSVLCLTCYRTRRP